MNYLCHRIYTGINFFLRLLSLTLIIRVLLFWIAGTKNKIYRWFYRFTEPFVEPFRRLQEKLLPSTSRIDLSFVLCMIAITLLDRIIRLILL